MAGYVLHRILKLTRDEWEHSAPRVWPPPLTFGQVRRLTAEALPHRRYRRHLMWRYTLLWTKPVP